MHSSRMRTVRNSSHLLLGGSSWPPPEAGTPLEQAPPQSRHPPRAGTFPEQAPPPEADMPPPETCCKACWDTTCNACWDSTPPLVNRITDTCKNITFATSLRTVMNFKRDRADLHARTDKFYRNIALKCINSYAHKLQLIECLCRVP